MSITYASKSSGPSTLRCSAAVVTLTSSDNCCPTLTLCVRLKKNSFIHTTTLVSTPKAAIFVSSRSRGTKSKVFEKSIIIASNLPLLSNESAMSWQTVITWVPHEHPGLKPCWPSNNQSFLSQTFLRHGVITLSICLHTTEVKLTSL
jgi:hypothetical protein